MTEQTDNSQMDEDEQDTVDAGPVEESQDESQDENLEPEQQSPEPTQERVEHIQRYQATEVVKFAMGTFIELDEDQAAARAHALAETQDEDIYEVVQPVEFKIGEIIGLVEMGPHPDIQEIANAILDLDRDNKELWTERGAPQVKALEISLGRDITAADRNAAWVLVKSGWGKRPAVEKRTVRSLVIVRTE
jgi:hypothetical protein